MKCVERHKASDGKAARVWMLSENTPEVASLFSVSFDLKVTLELSPNNIFWKEMTGLNEGRRSHGNGPHHNCLVNWPLDEMQKNVRQGKSILRGHDTCCQHNSLHAASDVFIWGNFKSNILSSVFSTSDFFSNFYKWKIQLELTRIEKLSTYFENQNKISLQHQKQLFKCLFDFGPDCDT